MLRFLPTSLIKMSVQSHLTFSRMVEEREAGAGLRSSRFTTRDRRIGSFA